MARGSSSATQLPAPGSGDGEVRVYEFTNGDWRLLGSPIVRPPGDDGLGTAVAISADGQRIVAGAPTRGFSEGVARVFDLVGDSWSPSGVLVGTGSLGASLAMSADGTRFVACDTGGPSGQLLIFERTAGAWQQVGAQITGSLSSEQFGRVVDGDGSQVLTGAPNFDTFKNNAGQLTVFDLGVPGPLSGGVPATLIGTASNDRLIGTTGPDVIVGLQGNDIIKGLGGDDIVCSGKGDDIIFGGQGFDIVFGAQGDDLIYASNRWDRIRGGPGNDTLFGYEGRDWMRGGEGVDRVDGGLSIDDLHGGNGNDVIIVSGNDTVRGGAGAKDRCQVAAGSMPTLTSCELR
jgi:Ca2+-binding RTX toxin-like protein